MTEDARSTEIRRRCRRKESAPSGPRGAPPALSPPPTRSPPRAPGPPAHRGRVPGLDDFTALAETFPMVKNNTNGAASEQRQSCQRGGAPCRSNCPSLRGVGHGPRDPWTRPAVRKGKGNADAAAVGLETKGVPQNQRHCVQLKNCVLYLHLQSLCLDLLAPLENPSCCSCHCSPSLLTAPCLHPRSAQHLRFCLNPCFRNSQSLDLR